MSGEIDRLTTATLTVAVVALTLNAFDCCLSPVSEVSGQPPSPARTALIRAHVVHASVLSLALGLGASIVGRSAYPLIGSALAAGWMAYQYDQAARRMPPPA
jgi:hypothetical protein